MSFHHIFNPAVPDIHCQIIASSQPPHSQSHHLQLPHNIFHVNYITEYTKFQRTAPRMRNFLDSCLEFQRWLPGTAPFLNRPAPPSCPRRFSCENCRGLVCRSRCPYKCKNQPGPNRVPAGFSVHAVCFFLVNAPKYRRN